MIKDGFKRITAVVLDENEQATDQKFVIEGKQDKGATTEATITGISPDFIKKFGSNVAYWVSAKGVGDVKADISMIDVPNDMVEAVLGRKKHADGFTLIGEDTEPPYCAVLLETEAKGEPLVFALLKGKFSANDESMKTNEDKPAEPEDEKLSFSCVANKDGQTIAYGAGTELKTKIEAYAFPTATPPEG